MTLAKNQGAFVNYVIVGSWRRHQTPVSLLNKDTKTWWPFFWRTSNLCGGWRTMRKAFLLGPHGSLPLGAGLETDEDGFVQNANARFVDTGSSFL